LLSPIYLFKVHSGGLEKQSAEAGNSASQEVCRRERRHRHRHHQPHPHSSSPYSPWNPPPPLPLFLLQCPGLFWLNGQKSCRQHKHSRASRRKVRAGKLIVFWLRTKKEQLNTGPRVCCPVVRGQE